MLLPNIRRYMKHGTLPQLRVFEASARLGSFTRASEELHMSQPAVSGQIRKLSETVGLPLFEHVGKRIVLTAAGERLHASCKEVFQAFAALEESLDCMRALESGHVRLAVSTTGMSFAPRLLGAFAEHYPGVEVSLAVHPRQTLVERLADSADDIYLFADPPEMEDVVTQELLPNPLVVLARDDHRLAGEKNIAFERLAQEPFLIREEGSGTRRIAMRLFHERGLAPRIRMELGTNEAIREAILAGLGVAILSRHTFGLDPESSRYVCLDVEGFPLESHWYLVYAAGRRPTAAALAFLDFARGHARSMVREGFIRADRERKAAAGARIDPM